MPGELLAGKSVSVGQARIEGAIVALIREWAMAHLSELTNLERLVKHLRDDGGDRPGKNMMHMAEIPTSLHNRLKRLLGYDYLHDPWLRKLVLRNFTVGLVNRSSPGVKGE
jgi:hypothetical protein